MERTTGGYAMRIRTIGILATGAMAVAACGSAGSQSPSRPRAPTPVNLTVYVNDSRVLVSPSSLGAGPVLFIVTNQASASESLAISASGSSTPLASTAPINPQGTTQVQVDVAPGEYTIATVPHAATEADVSRLAPIQPARLHIGRERPSGDNNLLQP